METKIMEKVLHKANSRGHADYGWLKTSYTFSFANYYDPARVHFGKLRVLNDDYVAGGQGFDMHPHDNMEIVTIILEGVLQHKDSMGNTFNIRKNDVQMMSAGTGIFHSEINPDPENAVMLLQIWVYPEKKNITPRYDQKTYDPADRVNKWQRVVSPDEPEAVSLNQQAWFSLARLEKGKALDYTIHREESCLYVFIIEGSVEVADTILERRDGLGISGLSDFHFSAKEDAEILVMEIPR
ncbi:MAG: pirin family protein [Syntrophothermus sp.]